MAFLVENGTGLSASNAYISVADADTHHTDRENTKWDAASTAEKQSCLIRASDYIEKRFGRKFRGYKKTAEQAMEWPRSGALDNDGHTLGYSSIPPQLAKATAEYALRAYLLNVLAPDVPSTVPSQDNRTGGTTGTIGAVGEIIRDKKVVDVIETEVEYLSPSQMSSGAVGTKSSLVASGALPQYPEADLWIEELLRSSNTRDLIRG